MILRDGKRIDLPEPQEQNMTDLEPSNEALERRVAQLETQNINLNEQLQQALQNLQAATAAANAAATAAATATNRNSNRTINMNVYNNDIYINNSEDKKLWLKAISDEPKVQYDLSNKNFDTFLAAVREKVGDYVLNRNNTTASQTKSEKSDNNMKLELNDELKSAMMTLNMDTNSLGLNKWAWGSCGVR